jgi:hypothetical protein
MFDLMAFSFSEGIITKVTLNELLRLTLINMPYYHGAFFMESRPVLIQQLQTLLGRMSAEILSNKQILCLQLIVQDYEQGLLGKNTQVNDVLVNKLLTSVTLSTLRPKPEITTGVDIRVETFPAYFTAFAQRVALLPLNNSEKNAMHDVILPGIEAIIRDEDAIVHHVTSHKAELYFLNGTMPLHTDHVQTADADGYRQTLRRLLINLFGAVEIAHNKGRLSELCGKLCSGVCLEGRVREAFTWVASLSEIVSFEELMYRYIHQEYVPYSEVMFGVCIEDLASDPTVCEFIMARHKGMPCLIHSTYAPNGELTLSGIRKYLTEVLDYKLDAGTRYFV